MTGARHEIWKGRILLGPHEVPVKLYSAVEDRAVHFKLVSRADHRPVTQRIVRRGSTDEVPREERRKAVPLDDGRAVMLSPEELESLEPPPSRDIHLCRFVPATLLGDPWFDRPYYLGPDGGDDAYFALARAVAGSEAFGIARWVMRKQRYLGAICASGDHLMMITLRRAEQVLALPQIQSAPSRAPSPAELKLAAQLVESVAGDFEPDSWPNEHRERLRALIDAKVNGRKVRPFKAPVREQPGEDLAQVLRASLARGQERRVA